MSSGRVADRARISAIEAEISNLRDLIRVLRAERKLVEERLNSYQYPILTLPNELTSEIFIHLLPTYPYCSPLTGQDSPSILTLICRKWRDIALSTPALWRAILLEDRYLHLVKAWLARTGCFPLALRCYDETCSDEMIEAIIPHRARWEHVSLEFWHGRGPLPAIDGPLPSLRELEIHISANSNDALDFLPAFADVPNLTAATLWDFVYPTDLLPWSQLISLILIAKSPSECTQILLQTPNLVHCELMLSCETVPQPDIYLPHLQRLILGCHYIEGDDPETEYLHSFVVPGLRSLQIPENFLGPDPIATLEAFLPKSQCKLYELHITGKRSFSTTLFHRELSASIPRITFNSSPLDWMTDDTSQYPRCSMDDFEYE
ncbi:hypothetical protein DFH06DRAFT_1327105 [Mycena polygramma]|nr:hypothetical protein DFH06DRAFT_1327105 [Mycena polygramma]